MPAKAGIQGVVEGMITQNAGFPAYAGMTTDDVRLEI